MPVSLFLHRLFKIGISGFIFFRWSYFLELLIPHVNFVCLLLSPGFILGLRELWLFYEYEFMFYWLNLRSIFDEALLFNLFVISSLDFRTGLTRSQIRMSAILILFLPWFMGEH